MANSRQGSDARALASDAIFCALIIVFSLLFSSLAYLSRSVFGIFIAAFMGLYFNRKPLLRCATISAAILALLFLLHGPVTGVVIYLPNILAGLVLGLTYRMQVKYYIPATTAALAVISGGEFYLYATLMLGRSVFQAVADTLSKYEFLKIPPEWAVLCTVFYLCMFCIVMAGMKTLIALSLRRIILRKFPGVEKLL